MKNRIISILFIIVLFIIFTIPVFADTIPSERLLPRLVDDANLLTAAEQRDLLEKLDEISERQKCDVVVVTLNSIGGMDSQDFADDFYDYNGYGMTVSYDGILLLISMEERDWAISTYGFGITAFTDAGLRYMEDQFVKYLGNGDYNKAFNTYADLSDKFISQARTGQPYDANKLPKKNPPAYWILIALAIGIVFGFIITGVMKSKLKTVHMQTAAKTYIKNNSLNISRSQDMFLYANVDRRAKEKSSSSGSSSGGSGSSTHTSSSGRSHGGSSGKF